MHSTNPEIDAGAKNVQEATFTAQCDGKLKLWTVSSAAK